MSNADNLQENIYENVGGDEDVEDDGWNSSEFEECDDEDQRSVGACSQTSQGSVDGVVRKTKNLFRRKIPSRISWGKPGSDMQSMVSCLHTYHASLQLRSVVTDWRRSTPRWVI